MTNIKRATIGGYIMAFVNNERHCGRITAFDDKNITFLAEDTFTYVAPRDKCYKATPGEVAKATEEFKRIREEEKLEIEILAEELKDFDEHPELTETTPNRSIVGKSYKEVYQKTRCASKRQSQDCGDELAQLMRGLTLEKVYEKTAKIMGLAPAELQIAYSHLNNGQIRMVLGNRIRGMLKNGKTSIGLVIGVMQS